MTQSLPTGTELKGFIAANPKARVYKIEPAPGNFPLYYGRVDGNRNLATGLIRALHGIEGISAHIGTLHHTANEDVVIINGDDQALKRLEATGVVTSVPTIEFIKQLREVGPPSMSV